MKKIKVAHILHSVGGVDVSLRLITENINSDEIENIIIHGIDDTSTPFINDKNSLLTEYKLPIYRNISFFKDIKALKKTIKILKIEKPNLIHAHSAKGGVLGKIAGKLLGIPVLHTPQAYSYLSATGLKKGVFKLIEKLLKALKNNKILASSNSERDRAINEIGYPTYRALLFNNCVAPINEIKPLSIKKTWSDNYICSVGRPSFQKNIEYMLDVLYELKNKNKEIHLVLMGVGFHSPNLQSVNNKIAKLNLQKNITTLEWTDREDIFNIIKNAELYISTARYEGLPYSVIESLALGKPLVVSDADGNRDLVVDGVNGYIIKEQDPKSFSYAVQSILSDKTKKENYGLKSLELFNKKFNIYNNITDLEKIYNENQKPNT